MLDSQTKDNGYDYLRGGMWPNEYEPYQVVGESVSAHCCFTHSVIEQNGLDDCGWKGRTVCECFSAEDASLLAMAMNALEGNE